MTNSHRISLGVVLLIASTTPLLSATALSAAERLEYNRDIRPILAENCFACHGPDSAARKAGLRLDSREEATKAAIVPGRPESSELIERIFTKDEEQLMPPVKSFKKLTEAQKEALKRWIAEGAEYQPHWSYIPPKRPAVPVVKNSAWVRNPIDSFILYELEKRGLEPAPEADRYTLARRLSLDLTGLPPDPAEVAAFVNDQRMDAYERYVDHLLKSPHWGEHRGRYWLDAARYADTHGIHFDNYREMWSYRDWVINAFNRNQPFDQFTIEQLAGDLLPNPSLEQRIATGFNRCNITSNEGGLIPEEYLVLYTRDRVETTAQVWLGLTAGCAVCHEHKFDPMSQKEFYELAAFFNNTTQGAMDGNIKDTPPIVMVPRIEDRARWDVLSREVAEVRKQTEERKHAARAEFDKWLGNARPDALYAKLPSSQLVLHALLSDGGTNSAAMLVGSQLRPLATEKPLAWDKGHVAAQALKIKTDAILELQEVGDFEKDQAFSYGCWVKLPRNNMGGAIIARMDDAREFRGWDLWVEGNKIGAHIIHKWPQDALKVVANEALKPNQWTHVFVTYDGSAKPSGLNIYYNGVLQQAKTVQTDTLKNTIKAEVPFKIGQRHSTSPMDGVLIQDLRVYARALATAEVETLARGTRAAWLVQKPAGQRSPQEKDELFAWWLPDNDQAYKELTGRLRSLEAEEAGIKARGTVAHVMQEKPDEPMAYVLYRGDYDKRRDPVKPSTPRFLPPFPSDAPKNRLGLAQWLLRPEHPLTTRVTVNRFWQEVFGTGLVRTSGDFGVSGELPSHPELLDWLAIEFRERNWDVKDFFRLLVTSSTYRQSAVTTPLKLEKDRENRLLSRGPRFRMDAEMIRDHALASSGLLVRKIGGPSVKPYQPPGVWEAVAMIGSNTRDYRPDKGENLYRRSLYTFWKRSAPPASMEILNAPNRETCVVRRERTNTPLQALLTLNDPQFVEAARILAEKALKEGGGQNEERLHYLAGRLVARPFRPEEVKILEASLHDLHEHFKAQPEEARKLLAVGETKSDPGLDPSTHAAWTMLVNQLMNLDEVLNK